MVTKNYTSRWLHFFIKLISEVFESSVFSSIFFLNSHFDFLLRQKKTIKTCVESSKVTTISWKRLDFFDTNLFDTFLWQKYYHIWRVINDTRQQTDNKSSNIEKLFFLFWKTIVFNVMKAISYILLSKFWPIYLSMKTSETWKFNTTQKKVKTTAKDKIKKFN